MTGAAVPRYTGMAVLVLYKGDIIGMTEMAILFRWEMARRCSLY